MAREIAQYGFALADAVVAIAGAENLMRPRLVDVLAEFEASGISLGEAAAIARAADGPAGEYSRKARDIFLRVAAIDAERMQFENFPGQILIEPERLIAAEAV